MTRRESVLISTVTVMPGVSGMIASSIFIAVSSRATVTGKTKLSGWPGAVGGACALIGRGGGVGEGALGLLFRDGAGGDLDDLAVQRAEAGEGEGVDLDHGVLAGLDEADVEIGDERLDLKLAAVRRDHDELLAGGDDLADRGDGRLLNDAVDRRVKLGASEARSGLGERLTRLVGLARGFGELVLDCRR